MIAGYDGAREGDTAIFINFRPDRARELTLALADPDFSEFTRSGGPVLDLTTMTSYREGWPYPVAFPEERPQVTRWPRSSPRPAGRQLHVAETEKYPHVTYFFNGGREAEPGPGEDRVWSSRPVTFPPTTSSPR